MAENWLPERAHPLLKNAEKGGAPRALGLLPKGWPPARPPEKELHQGNYLTAGPSSSYGELFGERNQ